MGKDSFKVMRQIISLGQQCDEERHFTGLTSSSTGFSLGQQSTLHLIEKVNQCLVTTIDDLVAFIVK